VSDFLPPSGPVTVDQYVEWLFIADQMDPASPQALKLRPILRAAFIECMGAEAVDAADLRYSDEIEADD